MSKTRLDPYGYWLAAEESGASAEATIAGARNERDRLPGSEREWSDSVDVGSMRKRLAEAEGWQATPKRQS